MQYDLLNNLTPFFFLMKSVKNWGSAGQKTISKWGIMKSAFLQILMISSAIEIVFMI